MTVSGADQKPAAIRLAIFLHLIGDDEALQVYNTFSFASDAVWSLYDKNSKIIDFVFDYNVVMIRIRCSEIGKTM